MSQLPNAPLVEVVVELRWKVDKPDLTRIQYLYGDIYNELKDKYPYRESVHPFEVPLEIILNQPAHRYRSGPNSYPLIQVGPGIITLNIIDSIYYWESFFEDAKELILAFLKVFPLDNPLSPGLLYLDFFPFDFKSADVYRFVNENFKIHLEQSFYENENFPNDFNCNFSYPNNLGNLLVMFQKGENTSKKDGILIQTKLNGLPLKPEANNIANWLVEAHQLCRTIFRTLTEGKLYETFL